MFGNPEPFTDGRWCWELKLLRLLRWFEWVTLRFIESVRPRSRLGTTGNRNLCPGNKESDFARACQLTLITKCCLNCDHLWPVVARSDQITKWARPNFLQSVVLVGHYRLLVTLGYFLSHFNGHNFIQTLAWEAETGGQPTILSLPVKIVIKTSPIFTQPFLKIQTTKARFRKMNSGVKYGYQSPLGRLDRSAYLI